MTTGLWRTVRIGKRGKVNGGGMFNLGWVTTVSYWKGSLDRIFLGWGYHLHNSGHYGSTNVQNEASILDNQVYR